MKNKAFRTFDKAVADISDGSTIMFPGFGGVGTPQNLIAALHRLRTRSLLPEAPTVTEALTVEWMWAH